MSLLTDEAFVVDKPAIRAQLAEAQALCRTLEKLSKAHIAALSSSRGRKRDRARRIAVDALCWIFWESTGQMPTREIDRINSQPISRFHNFCVAALKPVHGEEATTGLDNIIRGSMA